PIVGIVVDGARRHAAAAASEHAVAAPVQGADAALLRTDLDRPPQLASAPLAGAAGRALRSCRVCGKAVPAEDTGATRQRRGLCAAENDAGLAGRHQNRRLA